VNQTPDRAELDPTKIRDLSPLALDHDGHIRVLPAAFWAATTVSERGLFGHRHGIYGFPTIELVEHLTEVIAGRPAIEIGAGNGVLAQALDIPATDNRMQIKDRYRRIYEETGQPIVNYGNNIIELDAQAAVRRYKPAVVIGCWVTHKYNLHRHDLGGNEIGIDEADVINNVDEYVVIGNDHVHRQKPTWNLPHTRTHPAFVYSRATNGTRDFIATWSRSDGTRKDI
jgi:hypothetical protein